MDDRERALRRAAELALEFLASLPTRPVGGRVDASSLAADLGGSLPDDGEDPTAVIEDMARLVEPGLVASAGPRYFGLVTGGAVPASVAADWLVSAWDQNAVLHVSSPAATAAELVAGRWMLDLLGLPADASFGLPTGAGLGNTVGLAAARHAVLDRVGWDVEARGLFGAPEIAVVLGDEAHATIQTSLQYLGLGRDRVHRVAADEQGRLRSDALASTLDDLGGVPTLVIAQAGNVNTGAIDPFPEIADILANHLNAWLHVDGAFGLWANASPSLRHLVAGVERADSWSTDAHKWLNVNYDSGFVAVRDPIAHRVGMHAAASYLMGTAEQRHNWEYVLDSSRRARGFALYATLRSLGRNGVSALVERCSALARLMAEQLAVDPQVELLNEVVLNQVLVRFHPPHGDEADTLTKAVIARVQQEGVAWLGGTNWHGMEAMRISVSNWSTTEDDVDRTVASILKAVRA